MSIRFYLPFALWGCEINPKLLQSMGQVTIVFRFDTKKSVSMGIFHTDGTIIQLFLNYIFLSIKLFSQN